MVLRKKNIFCIKKPILAKFSPKGIQQFKHRKAGWELAKLIQLQTNVNKKLLLELIFEILVPNFWFPIFGSQFWVPNFFFFFQIIDFNQTRWFVLPPPNFLNFVLWKTWSDWQNILQKNLRQKIILLLFNCPRLTKY